MGKLAIELCTVAMMMMLYKRSLMEYVRESSGYR